MMILRIELDDNPIQEFEYEGIWGPPTGGTVDVKDEDDETIFVYLSDTRVVKDRVVYVGKKTMVRFGHSQKAGILNILRWIQQSIGVVLILATFVYVFKDVTYYKLGIGTYGLFLISLMVIWIVSNWILNNVIDRLTEPALWRRQTFVRIKRLRDHLYKWLVLWVLTSYAGCLYFDPLDIRYRPVPNLLILVIITISWLLLFCVVCEMYDKLRKRVRDE